MMTSYRTAFRDSKRNQSVTIFSAALAFSIPLILGLYWPIYSLSETAGIVMLRPLMAGIPLLLALAWCSAPITSAETRAACVLGFLSAVLLVPSLASIDPARALADWVKLLILCAVCLLLCRALRHQGTATSLGWGLILAAVLTGLFTAVTYVRFRGFTLPSYQSARELKGIAQTADIPLNAIPFASMFSFLAGMCLVRANWFLWSLGLVLLAIATVLTGSRAPLAVLLFSAMALALLNALRNRHLPVRLTAYFLAAAIPLATAVLIFHLTPKQMSALTEGRWDLWYVACKNFADRPLLGSGYDSWQQNLPSLLPGDYHPPNRFSKNFAGAYHNEYLTLLAEQGLVGFFSALAVVYFLFGLSWKSAFRRWHTWHNGQWALFACLFLLTRAGLEVPGLFGYGSEPADYLAYVFFAIVISRFSTEEDFLRACTSTSWDRALSPIASAPPNDNPRQPAQRPGWAEGRDVSLGVGRSYV